ncbi:MAG: DUF1385 domain-containing protein [Abitibacteriaceae bacterium]|nr:DUF1385 domain-containing protein [Abditibacteriaceae bacterium]
MPFLRAGQLARSTPTARLDDPLGLVAENLRASNYGAIPVLDRGFIADNMGEVQAGARVLGLVDERDLSHYALPVLAQRQALSEATSQRVQSVLPGEMILGETQSHAHYGSNGSGLNGHNSNGYHPSAQDTIDEEVATIDFASLTARDVMRRDIGIVPAVFSLQNALMTLERYDALALPVIDTMGSYRGMISRSDVLAALGGQVRPPVVGGMATPIGVWLTTGTISAGAPPLGLFLSGMTMAACLMMAQIIMLIGLNAISSEWGAMFYSGRLGATSESGSLLNLIVTLVQSLLFLVLMRSLPLSGIHAAEHQTVWAIERGLPLTPEYVAQMPRAHPRCGTNLVALGGLIQISFQHLPEINSGTVLATLLFIYLAWRNFGTLLQEWFTTKPATPKQLASGIKAGRELMEKYQEQPHVLTSFGSRLFNSGLIMSALGMILTLGVFNFLEDYVARLIFFGS